MTTFIVREKKSGILLPLAELIDRIRLDNITSWRFRQITMGHGTPFGMNVGDFEAASRVPNGFTVSDDDFRMFLKSDFQILDGEIEALSDRGPGTRVMCLDCQDATQWEITTDAPELIAELERAHFARA